jgi:AraC-like DNA-binding protein
MQTWPPINQNPKTIFAIHRRVGCFATDWHMHPKHQLLYAEEGVLHLLSGKYQLILPARHGAWIPAHRFHKIYSNSPDLYLRNVYFHEREKDEEILRQFHIFPISALAREMIVYTQTWSTESEAGKTERSFLETIRLLAIDWCKQTIPLVLPTTEHDPLERITAYIGDNLRHPLRLDTVAQKYGFSGRTLLRLFKDQLGMTFGTYIRVARIIKAIELLTNPNASVTDVAYEVGYNSLSSFSRAFQQLTGTKPREYLRNSANGGSNLGGE